MRDLVPRTVPRPRWWDGGIVLLYALLAVPTTLVWDLRVFTGGFPAPPAVRLGIVLLVCLAALWRTRRPGPALVAALPPVAADLLTGASLVGVFVLADLLYCAVLHGSRRTSEVTRHAAVTAWLMVTGLFLLTIADPAAVLRSVLSAAALLVLPVMWARDVRRPQQEAAAEREASAQAARIAELDRGAAVADERARIARDLHDSVAGHLSAISLQSQAALRADDETRDRVLHAVRRDSVRALDEMRALIEVLRRPADSRAGTGPDVASDVPPDAVPEVVAAGLVDLDGLADSARATGLTVTTRIEGTADLPPAVDLTAYRIAQEALTNVSRHAPGAAVELVVERRGGALVVEVRNDRAGAAARAGSSRNGGTGVEGMRIRAEAVGGRVEAGPTNPAEQDGRWRVRAELPLSGDRPVRVGARR